MKRRRRDGEKKKRKKGKKKILNLPIKSQFSSWNVLIKLMALEFEIIDINSLGIREVKNK